MTDQKEVIERLLGMKPFSLTQEQKDKIYLEELRKLTDYHCLNSPVYAKILRVLNYAAGDVGAVESIPFIPVRLFKEYELVSVAGDEIIKTMTSSGTTGQAVSKIMLDRSVASNQTKVLAQIVSDFIGAKRLPMLIIDSQATVKNRFSFSARGAGILGFSMFGRDITYALDNNMNLDLPAITAFLEKHQSEQILLFGFTFIIWQHFYLPLKKAGSKLPIDNGILIHGGGWKKLADMEISNESFKKNLNEICNIKKIFNYYGMVEQTGSIFMECQHGNLHASIFSDLIIRCAKDFAPLEKNKTGLIQLVSLLPTSYPGQSILTEDVGEITGIDECPCGRLGKTFKIHGRIKNAEARGCSDTYSTPADNILHNTNLIDVNLNDGVNLNNVDQNGVNLNASNLSDVDLCGKCAELRDDFGNLSNLAGSLADDFVPVVNQPYSEIVIDFLNDISQYLRNDKTASAYSDVISFAFWCRRANVSALRAAFVLEESQRGAYRVGRGVIFHIAPSNVPVNFAFSFVFGLLAGNSNIVRVPSKLFPQTEIICRAIAAVMSVEKYQLIRKSNSFVRYERDDKITEKFSAKAQCRIIWGGDNTIQNIRKFQIAPNGVEITFADRYSLSLINADTICESDDAAIENLANNFYNDTYVIDQNACSSPHLILWTNNNFADQIRSTEIKSTDTNHKITSLTQNARNQDSLVQKKLLAAQDKFWRAVYKRVSGDVNANFIIPDQLQSNESITATTNATNTKPSSTTSSASTSASTSLYDLRDIHAVDKYTRLCQIGVDADSIVSFVRYGNFVYRVKFGSLPKNLERFRGKFGLFFEYDLFDAEEICNHINQRYQTLTYFGIDSNLTANWLVSRQVNGIDRIVPIGTALSIGVVWDGHDIIRELSRIIDTK